MECAFSAAAADRGGEGGCAFCEALAANVNMRVSTANLLDRAVK